MIAFCGKADVHARPLFAFVKDTYRHMPSMAYPYIRNDSDDDGGGGDVNSILIYCV